MRFFEESIEEAFMLLFEGASEGIVVVNSKQVIVATNASARLIFGYEDHELEGKSLEILIPMRFHKAHDGHFNKFLENSGKREMGVGRDLYGLRKDGAQIPVEAGLNPFYLHGHRYVMALVTDITVRKQYENQILELNENLEEKIKQRTQILRKAVSKLKKEVQLRIEAEEGVHVALKKEQDLNELKTKFLSLVSHEFKTPLAVISTSATLAGKYTDADEQEKREKHLATIKNKVKYLNNIIDDFLSIERLDTGKTNYNITSFSLNTLINQVIEDVAMLLKQGQTVACDEIPVDFHIRFDEKVMELVMSNLLYNAIKYSGEESTVEIKIEVGQDQLQIHVIDQGIGIPEKEQEFIFNRYFRAENALLNAGTGIGLNIVKNHLKNLGGSISFFSKLNNGSTFSITIPTDTKD
jgi:PAS domain S-box-containing protein